MILHHVDRARPPTIYLRQSLTNTITVNEGIIHGPVFCFKLGKLTAEKNHLQVELRIGNPPICLVVFVNQPFLC